MACHDATVRPLSTIFPSRHSNALTKIAATIGPAGDQAPRLQSLAKAGMDVMRINFSYAMLLTKKLTCAYDQPAPGRAGPKPRRKKR